MSYVCQRCQKSMPARSKPQRIVVERYSTASKINLEGEEVPSNKSGQIKREQDVCPDCAVAQYALGDSILGGSHVTY